jgi:hypothetical protein
MPDSLTRLRESDPAAHAATPPPPDDVLRAILASTPAKPKRRRAPRLVLVAASLAVAGLVAIAALPGAADHAPTPIRESLAQRAFAATAPNPDFITYTRTTTVQTGGPASMESYDELRQWQYQDRMHNFMFTRQPRGEWTYEHDQDGGTMRGLMHNNKGGSEFQITHKTDPGWDPEELASGFEVGVTTLVDRFREEIKKAKDLGETTFNGKPAHAYLVTVPWARHRPGDVTYYVDPKTALPLGSTMRFPIYRTETDREADGEVTTTTTVDDYQQLEATPENLKLLDAPNLDAAQIKKN